VFLAVLGGVLVIHHKRLGTHVGVALHDMDVAAEGRKLLLVAHLQRGSLDIDRLVAVRRKARQRIGWPLLRQRADASKHGCAGQHGCRHHNGEQFHVWGPFMCHRLADFSPDRSFSGTSTMVTPPSKRITSPELVTSSLFALMVPCRITTSTGCSETM